MLLAFIWGRLGSRVSDDIYLKVRFRLVMKRPLRLNNPLTFNEKINWLKLYNRQPFYTNLVDKAAVKSYVKSILGEEYIIPTLGVWDKFDDIDFSTMPNQFVLKSTNGGGGSGVIVCKDKISFDKVDARKKLEKSMKTNWKIGREWVYEGVKPRIIAEKLLDSQESDLLDYKFFCFNGVVKCFKIDFDRYTNHGANYYSRNGELLPFGEVVCPPQYNKQLEIPANLDKMLILAERLSHNQPFIRVDFYNLDKRIYFGELTFYPNSGFGPFTVEEWDYKLGSMIQLPQ